MQEFYKDLEHGKSFESEIEPLISQVLNIKNFKLVNDLKKQSNGIDAEFEMNNKTYTVDLKIANNYCMVFKNIAIETISDIKRGKKGWLYTSEMNYLLFGWKNKAGNKIELVYLIKFEMIKEYLKSLELKKHYTKSKRGSATWTTEFILLSIKDFPENSIIKIPC